MRKNAVLLIIMSILVFGCRKDQASSSFRHIDSLMVAEQYETAYHEVCRMDTSSLSSDEEKAYFGLLVTKVCYLTDRMVESEAWIDGAISYYEETKDKEHLADALYYKASRLLEKGEEQQAIVLLKKAEEQAEKTDNQKLQYKIMVSITNVNDDNANYGLQLKYARKTLDIALKSGDRKWLAYSYYRMSLAFMNIGDNDSLYYYTEKIIPFLGEVEKNDMPYFLSSIGYIYKKKDPQLAKQYLEQSMDYEVFARTLENLADIYYEEGDSSEAYRLWERAFLLEDNSPKDNIIFNMLQYDVEHQDKEAVCEKIYHMVLIKDSMAQVLRDRTIADLQQRFDEKMAANQFEKERMRWIILALALILAVVMMASVIKYKQYHAKKNMTRLQLLINHHTSEINQLKSEKDFTQRQMDDLREKVQVDQNYLHQLELKCLKNDLKIKEIKSKISELIEKGSPRLIKGKALYEMLEQKQSAAKWSGDDIQCFNDYYMAMFMNNYLKIERKYAPQTASNMFFLILHEMGNDDKEVGNILNITPEGVRSAWHRILRKKTGR